VLQDDFGGQWQPVRDMASASSLGTCDGKIHYLMEYVRLLPLQLQSGRAYRFTVALSPHIVHP
jgi:hypothetical protein